MRGAAVAEGSSLFLSIRLATDLLIGRYELPPAKYPDCLAARHEAGLLQENRKEFTEKIGGQHLSEAFNRLMLPRCKCLVEATGQRFLYEAAKEAGPEDTILDVYEVGIVERNPVWFAVHAGMDTSAQVAHEDTAISDAMPHLER
ncbi:hypothetical protein B0H13DRAFT_1620650 [Mycena leptocephala]|nr:hypothetical protein B0H13DRAFT_1620650 [Mycena leptocephala]